MDTHYLAVDMGGTKVAAALVDGAGRIRAAVQQPTCQEGPAAGIAQVIALLRQVLQGAGSAAGKLRAVGIGIPAVLAEDDGVIWAPNLAGWRDVDLATPVAQALGLPVAIEYDGHTATLAEWWLGAGQGCANFADVIIGTGIGGGLVLGGRLVRGVNRLAGAAGWFAVGSAGLHKPERPARERSLGTWEAQAAGPGIALRAQAAGLPYADAAELFAAAAAGDAAAQALLDETAAIIGAGVANIVSLVNPQRVILGGGVGSRCGPLLPQITAAAQAWAQPLSMQSCTIVTSPLGPEAGLLGAAYAAMLRFAPEETEGTREPERA